MRRDPDKPPDRCGAVPTANALAQLGRHRRSGHLRRGGLGRVLHVPDAAVTAIRASAGALRRRLSRAARRNRLPLVPEAPGWPRIGVDDLRHPAATLLGIDIPE